MLVCDTEIKLSLGAVENHLEGREKRNHMGLPLAEDGEYLATNPWWPCLEGSLGTWDRVRANVKH